MLPRSGDILCVTRSASVQFAEPLYFRVIRVHDWPTYDGWVWLDGYELNAGGDAWSAAPSSCRWTACARSTLRRS